MLLCNRYGNSQTVPLDSIGKRTSRKPERFRPEEVNDVKPEMKKRDKKAIRKQAYSKNTGAVRHSMRKSKS
jgi:hypothetical protein